MQSQGGVGLTSPSGRSDNRKSIALKSPIASETGDATSMSRSRPALRHSARTAHPCATQLSPVFVAALQATRKNGWRSVSRETVQHRKFPHGSSRRSERKIGGNLKSVNRTFMVWQRFVRTATGHLPGSCLASESRLWHGVSQFTPSFIPNRGEAQTSGAEISSRSTAG